MKQEDADKSYLRMAEVWAQNSKAERLKVGALVVKDRMVISDGFNGTPSGFDNWCEGYLNDKGEYTAISTQEEFDRKVSQGVRLKTKPEVLHAEANAITKLAKSTQSSDGATIYITHSPCIECAKLIIQSGIKKVVYKHVFRSTDGLELLRKANIEIVKYE